MLSSNGNSVQQRYGCFKKYDNVTVMTKCNPYKILSLRETLFVSKYPKNIDIIVNVIETNSVNNT